MAALGKIFEYAGDAEKAALSEVNLTFNHPTYSYEYAEAASSVIRTTGDGGVVIGTQDLHSHEYHVEISSQAFLGATTDSVSRCRQYVQQALSQSTLNLQDITMPIDVVFSDPATGTKLGQQQLQALYLLKTREPLARMAAPMTGGTSGVDTSTSTVILMNYRRYQKLFAEFGNLSGSSDDYLFIGLVRDFLTYVDDTTHALTRLTDAILETLVSVLLQRGVSNAKEALELLRNKFPELFEFTMVVPEIRRLGVAGVFSVMAPQGVAVTREDVARYDVSLECTVLSVGNAQSFTVQHLDWSLSQPIEQNQTPFSFENEEHIFVNAVDGFVAVKVKDPGGMVLWSRSYKPGDQALKNITIEVPLQRPNTLGDAQGALDKNKKLRGKVICLNREVSLKDLTVFVKAQKAGDGPWSIVSVGTTDALGNFTMPYPYGVYVAAQAIVSLAPKSPAGIPTNANAANNQSISDDFLYLLVEDAKSPEPGGSKPGDCGCESQMGAPRLPDHADLIGSDQYSQDIGGSCVNLSAPNRTLREYNYHAIVRASDPDVANYTLRKNKDGSFDLVGGAAKIKRAPVDLNNPIAWQNAPDHHSNTSLYQAVTVATGHILHYKSEFKADGYSMGDLIYSLALAPGQKKQIVVIDSLHKLQAAESQTLTQGERLTAGLVAEREITDQLGGGISEALSGSSSATTSGVSAGLGVGASFGSIGGSLGVAGGYANSNSSASQHSSRNVAQHFGESLRQAIIQNADSYRQQNASVVTTVQEGQHYATTTEVVANHNHCHALTMMYFEVLRHFAIYQDLADVEECVFVPLLMTNFTPDNISKWRDVLARHLLPVHSNTYLQPFNSRTNGRAHPLLKGFDAIDRIRTKYANVDFPLTTYDDEVIHFIKGTISIRTGMQRPKTRYDRVKSLPVVSKTVTHEEFDAASAAKSVALGVLTGGLSFLVGGVGGTKTVSEQMLAKGQIFDAFLQLDANYESVPPAKCIRVVNFRPVPMTIFGQTFTVSGGDSFFEDSIIDKKLWTTYASILGYSDVLDMLEYYFKGRLISEWDEIYNKDIAPVLFQKVVDSIRVDKLSLDLTTVGHYKGGEVVMRMTVNGTTPLKRNQLPEILNMKSSSSLLNSLADYITLTVDRVNLTYSTAHYHGPLYAGYVGNDLLRDGVTLFAPENDAEKRNPRKEDNFISEKLIEHLNSNIDHYNKVLWLNLDADRRYMLLDGFNIQVFDDFGQSIGFRSLASVVKNRLMSVVGNSLVFPVAAGYKVSKSYIAEKAADGTAKDVSLLDHYRPLTPPPPYRVSVPSRGVFLEAVQGACDACEKVKENTSQDWTKFTTDEPTPIAMITPPVPTVTDWKAAFKDFATPIVNIQNAPAAPAPGAGLAGLNELLGKSGIFKDITGLDANQQNVLRTYLSNQENAKAFAEMAKEMVMQGHNTQNSEKILGSLKGAKDSGAINQDDYGKLVKNHFQQQIDGGSASRAEQQSTKPTLTDAAVKAVDQGKTVKAQKIDPVGGVESVEITGGVGGAAENVLAKISSMIVPLKQDKTHACWAAVATMLMNWKQKKSMSVVDAMTSLGAKYLQIYNDNTGIMAADKPGLIGALGMIGEAPATYTVQQYIDWVNDYGPIWVTTDDAAATGEFAAHARILTRIAGTGTPDGAGTKMTFIDPMTGTEITQSFLEFESAFEQMVTDNPSDDLYVQVVRFADKVIIVGEGGSKDDPDANLPWLTVPKVNVATSAADKTDMGGLSETIAVADAEFQVSGVVTRNWRAAGVEQFGGSRIGTPMRQLIDITGIVLHETNGLNWAPPPPPSSVHLHIDRDGTVVQHNQFWHRCFHASSYNRSTIGIEHVNTPFINDPNQAPPDREGEVIPIKWGNRAWLALPPAAQMEACHQMVAFLRGRFSRIPDHFPQLLDGAAVFAEASAEAAERWFLVNTKGHDYFAAAGIIMEGIASHSALLSHEDGAVLALYTALRSRGLSSKKAISGLFKICGEPARYRKVTSHGILIHLVRVTDYL